MRTTIGTRHLTNPNTTATTKGRLLHPVFATAIIFQNRKLEIEPKAPSSGLQSTRKAGTFHFSIWLNDDLAGGLGKDLAGGGRSLGKDFGGVGVGSLGEDVGGGGGGSLGKEFG